MSCRDQHPVRRAGPPLRRSSHFTTAVAGWIRTLYLEDGSPPLGVSYLSKHGSNLTAYAIWLRAVDDGRPDASEVIQPLASAPITADDADLIAAAALNGMHVL